MLKYIIEQLNNAPQTDFNIFLLEHIAFYQHQIIYNQYVDKLSFSGITNEFREALMENDFFRKDKKVEGTNVYLRLVDNNTVYLWFSL